MGGGGASTRSNSSRSPPPGNMSLRLPPPPCRPLIADRPRRLRASSCNDGRAGKAAINHLEAAVEEVGGGACVLWLRLVLLRLTACMHAARSLTCLTWPLTADGLRHMGECFSGDKPSSSPDEPISACLRPVSF